MAHSPSQVGVRELRQNLSVYLDRVKRGEALTVTEHGRVVAMLQPPATSAQDALAKLIREGHATPAVRSPASITMPAALPGRKRRKSISAVLDELRADRF